MAMTLSLLCHHLKDELRQLRNAPLQGGNLIRVKFPRLFFNVAEKPTFIVKCPVNAECDTGSSALRLLVKCCHNRQVANANVG